MYWILLYVRNARDEYNIVQFTLTVHSRTHFAQCADEQSRSRDLFLRAYKKFISTIVSTSSHHMATGWIAALRESARVFEVAGRRGSASREKGIASTLRGNMPRGKWTGRDGHCIWRLHLRRRTALIPKRELLVVWDTHIQTHADSSEIDCIFPLRNARRRDRSAGKTLRTGNESERIIQLTVLWLYYRCGYRNVPKHPPEKVLLRRRLRLQTFSSQKQFRVYSRLPLTSVISELLGVKSKR